jgi:hypothetical protein
MSHIILVKPMPAMQLQNLQLTTTTFYARQTGSKLSKMKLFEAFETFDGI